jgi:hypothetical protein
MAYPVTQNPTARKIFFHGSSFHFSHDVTSPHCSHTKSFVFSRIHLSDSVCSDPDSETLLLDITHCFRAFNSSLNFSKSDDILSTSDFKSEIFHFSASFDAVKLSIHFFKSSSFLVMLF